MNHSLVRRSTLVAALTVAVAMLVSPVSAWAQKTTETVERTLPFPSGGTLNLKNFSGDVRITAGSGRNFVMKAVRRATADKLKEIQLIVETSGSTISVEANKRDRDSDRRDDNDDRNNNNVVETNFEIQVPADARLEIDAFSSDGTVTGITGTQRLKTFSGDISTSSPRGAVSAYAFSGDIEIDAMGQNTSPDVEAETFSGRMRVKLADNAKGNLEFNSFSSSFDADVAVTLRSSSRRKIRAELPGGSGRTLTFKSFSGSLRLVK